MIDILVINVILLIRRKSIYDPVRSDTLDLKDNVQNTLVLRFTLTGFV